jgi:hypothetical protein
MATTQPEREIPHERAFAWQMQPKAEYKSLRMSWVVVTDERGQRQHSACVGLQLRTDAIGSTCNIPLTTFA